MRPAHALFLRVSDYIFAIIYGVVATTASYYLIPDEWPMPLLMSAGMLVGTLSAFPLLAIFSVLLGGFEVIMMSMQIGMLGGMAGGIIGGASINLPLIAGASVGAAVQLFLHISDLKYHGEALLDNE